LQGSTNTSCKLPRAEVHHLLLFDHVFNALAKGRVRGILIQIIRLVLRAVKLGDEDVGDAILRRHKAVSFKTARRFLAKQG